MKCKECDNEKSMKLTDNGLFYLCGGCGSKVSKKGDKDTAIDYEKLGESVAKHLKKEKGSSGEDW